ncbi:hypothetical protein [Amycolatopsis sp.]|jgi:hypothetical protein|uniref:hypothetical protein n=1 Tax=Amycolatopsis sp. TaxID=37632 RepID=UPI002E06B348|nr:hypothetical protein [Amycolatopsis sp.]
MADRQSIARLGIAAVAVSALAGGYLILTMTGETPPAAAPVAVVGEPSPPSVSTPPPIEYPPEPTPVLAPQQSTPGQWQIRYELAGSGTATVVYDENGLGLVHQELAVTLPWRKELAWPPSGVAPTVKLLGQGEGQVECRVSVGGVLAVTQQAAAGEVASCAGKLG